MNELERVENKSLNRNPDIYETKRNQGFKMICLNIGNLILKFEDLSLDPVVKHADVIFLSETWLDVLDSGFNYDIHGYKLFLSNV